MKEIEQIVTDYLNFEDTDYAIMINGDWGSGKTYYIKNSLFSVIKGIASKISNNKNEKLNYEPLYVSLNGICDLNDILFKIHLEINPVLKSKPFAVINTGFNILNSVFSAGLSKKDGNNLLSIFNIGKNKLIFFDDLERLGGDLSVSSVLGQINSFVEHQNLKVIIVCNSIEIEKEFGKINEKTIRFSCLYNPDIENVYDQMITEYSSLYIDFLKEKKHVVIEVFNIAKYKNLRTLRFILDIFQKIFYLVEKEEYKNDLLQRFLLFTTIYSVEYKLGRQSEEELNSLKNVGPFFLSDIDFNNLIGRKPEEQVEREKSYVQLFNEKYSDLTESFHFCQEIADYVHNGYLNKEKLAYVVIEIIQEIKGKEETEEIKLITKIRNWRNLKDDDFEPLKEVLLKTIDDGKFTLIAYPIIFSEFLQMEFYDIHKIKIDFEFMERFKRGIDKSKENHKYSELFRAKLPYWSERDTTETRGKYNNICEYTLRANEYALSKSYDDLIKNFLSNIENSNSQEIDTFFKDTSNLFVPIFKDLNSVEFFKLLQNANSETLYALNVGIYNRCSDRDIVTEKICQDEKEFFVELCKLVQKQIEGIENRKISIVPFVDLERNLKRFLNE